MSAWAEPRTRALLALIAVMIVWGGTYAVTKRILQDVPPLTLAALRYVVAALVLLPFAWRRGGLSTLPQPVPWGTLALMGFSGIALYYAAFNLALVYTSASQGALVQATAPAVIAVAALLFLHERLTPKRITGIALSVLGVALVVTDARPQAEASHPVLGAALMMVTVFCWAVYTLLAKRLAKADEVVVAACVATFGALMLLPGLAFESLRGPLPAIYAQDWLAIVYLGSVCSALGYVVYSYALRHRDASDVGTWTNLIPIVGVVVSVVLLGEDLTALQVLGGTVALVGMWLAS